MAAQSVWPIAVPVLLGVAMLVAGYRSKQPRRYLLLLVSCGLGKNRASAMEFIDLGGSLSNGSTSSVFAVAGNAVGSADYVSGGPLPATVVLSNGR